MRAIISVDWAVSIEELETGRPLIGPLRHEQCVKYTVFSPDNRWFLTSSSDERVVIGGGGVQFYDGMTGAPIGDRMAHAGQSLFAGFSHDGSKLVTQSTDSFARLWEVPSGKAFGPPLQHGSDVTNAEFTADDAYLVTRTGDSWVRVWRVATGELALEPIRGGDGYTGSVHPSRPEVILAGTDGIMRRWNIVPGAQRTASRRRHRDR